MRRARPPRGGAGPGKAQLNDQTCLSSSPSACVPGPSASLSPDADTAPLSGSGSSASASALVDETTTSSSSPARAATDSALAVLRAAFLAGAVFFAGAA